MSTPVFFAKEDQGTITTREVLQKFRETNNLEQLRKTVENAEDRVFISWDTVEKVDNAKEMIPVDNNLLKHYDTYVNKRDGPITDMHSNRVVGKTLAYKVLQHPEEKKDAILSLNKIHDHTEFDDKIWNKVKKGEYTGVSLGGIAPPDKMQTVDGQLAKILDVKGVHEKAVVDRPENPGALVAATSMIAKMDKSERSDAIQSLEKKLEEAALTKAERQLAESMMDAVKNTGGTREDEEKSVPLKNKVAASQDMNLNTVNGEDTMEKNDEELIAAVAEEYGVDADDAADALAVLNSEPEAEAEAEKEDEDPEEHDRGAVDDLEEKMSKMLDEKLAGLQKQEGEDPDEDSAGVSNPVQEEGNVGEEEAEADTPQTPTEQAQDGEGDGEEAEDDEVDMTEKMREVMDKKLQELGLVESSSTPRPMAKGMNRFNQETESDYPAAVDPYETFIKSMHEGKQIDSQELHKINHEMKKHMDQDAERALRDAGVN